MNTDPTRPDPGSPEEHWGTRDPEGQPPLDQVKGLPRLVIETHTRLGPNASPERVAEELRKRGSIRRPRRCGASGRKAAS
jgi:hypothetical protein